MLLTPKRNIDGAAKRPQDELCHVSEAKDFYCNTSDLPGHVHMFETKPVAEISERLEPTAARAEGKYTNTKLRAQGRAHTNADLNKEVTVLHTASVGTAAGHNAGHKFEAELVVFQDQADASHGLDGTWGDLLDRFSILCRSQTLQLSRHVAPPVRWRRRDM